MKLRIVLATGTALGLMMSTGVVFAAGGNHTYLTQTGNDQDATIVQSGGSNNLVGSSGSPFLQQNGAGNGNNVLTIDQNTANAGSGNVATGYQSGTDNSADIDQNGSNSSVNLTQSGALNGSVSSSTWSNNPGDGDHIVQDSTASYSTVNVQQSNYVGADRGSIINIGQGGYNNHVTATQTANSGQASAARNDLWIRQGTTQPDLWGWTFGNPFWTAAYAVSNSTITVNQNAGDLSGVNYATLGQGNGSGDVMNVTQSGASNSVDANQVGGSNTFNSQQYSTNGNAGWNFVGGESGWPDSSFNPLTGTNGDFRPITQWGDGNTYISYQSGSDLWAFGNQIGNYNYLNNTQTGTQNKLWTSQIGDLNSIYSTQAGDNNVTTVSQSLNSNLSSTSQNGSNNIATVTQ